MVCKSFWISREGTYKRGVVFTKINLVHKPTTRIKPSVNQCTKYFKIIFPLNSLNISWCLISDIFCLSFYFNYHNLFRLQHSISNGKLCFLPPGWLKVTLNKDLTNIYWILYLTIRSCILQENLQLLTKAIEPIQDHYKIQPEIRKNPPLNVQAVHLIVVQRVLK